VGVRKCETKKKNILTINCLRREHLFLEFILKSIHLITSIAMDQLTLSLYIFW